MKTKFLIVALLLASTIASAETMRVAILEPVDRENKVSYGTKLILRSNLSKAVTNTEGYEAYDRSDMDAIMGEQNFQRTGLVSEDQIKRLGEMTGAKYILVAEAAVVDANNMFITAKVLDVESARTIMTDNLMMGIEASKIQEGCSNLAMRLFHTSASYDNTGNTKIRKTANNQKLIHHSKSEMKYLNTKEFTYGNEQMDEKEMLEFVQNRCPEAYLQLMKAKKMKTAGWAVMGATCLGAMFVYIPCLTEGYKKYDQAIEYFNKKCGE